MIICLKADSYFLALHRYPRNFIRVLFNKCLESLKILEIDDEEFSKELMDVLNRLPKIEIDKKGAVMEWLKEYEEHEPGHRHISHLFGLHPGDIITKKDTALFEAAKVTLARRLSNGGGHTGWSMAWLINMFARLSEGNEALNCLEGLLSKSTYSNLFDKHPPFQIDGNFGGTAAIVEMLIQSHSGYIEFLPALSDKWDSGKLTGVMARGGFEIDMTWDNMKMTKATIKSLAGQRCVILTNTDIVINGELYKSENSFVELETVTNKSYVIKW